MNLLIEQISRASTEQKGGIDQVNEAVATLDDTTRQNASMVQQSTEAASKLQAQAKRLAEAIGVFRA
ncbi:hypothetical protein [Ideonella lacteola]|uniref:hypothetical protein n=1 Tax=Ideonella lacteola TaxID=2984193 RepID=UPI003BF968CB